MTIPRAEIGREIPKNLQYLKEREQAFIELFEVFAKITAGKEFVLRLPDAAKKYSQFLSVSDREPLLKAVADWNKNFLVPHEKELAWAKILSVVMSSGANRCDVKSPGISEVSRLIPFSPFKDSDIVAHVTAFAIISPNQVLQPSAHHKDYWRMRRSVYYAVISQAEDTAFNAAYSPATNLCMGAEYFVAGSNLPAYQHLAGAYILEVVRPIDRRGE